MSVTARIFGFALAVVSLAAVPAHRALAQDFPNRPIRMILPTSPGAGSDLIGRVIANQLSGLLGQPIVPDNRPGAGGIIGVNAVRTAAPDGYTIAFSNASQSVHSPLLAETLPFDPVKDIETLAIVYKVLIGFVAHPAFPPKNMKEFIEYAKANPGKVNYASTGQGTLGHLWPEMLKQRAGIQATPIHYKGAGPAIQSVIAGETHVVISETFAFVGRESQVKILAQLGDQRSAKLPNVETVREAGYPELTAGFWFGFLGPKGMPPAIQRRLNADINRAMATPEVTNRITSAGGELVTNDLAQSAAIMAAEVKTWAPIIRELGLKVQ